MRHFFIAAFIAAYLARVAYADTPSAKRFKYVEPSAKRS